MNGQQNLQPTLEPGVAVSIEGSIFQVAVEPSSSTDATRLIHLLTDPAGSADIARIIRLLTDPVKSRTRINPHGMLAGVKWSNPQLNGRTHTLTARGELADNQEVILVVHQMAAGFAGSGSMDSAAILAHLGFGAYEDLYHIITTPPEHLAPHDAWKVRLGPKELTQKKQ